MQTARIPLALSLGLLVCLCGCYHYGYQPYGTPYGGYGPGTYPAGPGGGSMGPSPSYVPYGSPSGPSPTPISPNGTQPNWQPPGGNPAPNYDGSNPQDKPVPTPPNDEKEFGGAPAEAHRTPGNQPAAGGLSGSGIQLQPIEAGPSYPSGAATQSTAVAGSDDPFEAPLRPTSGGANVTARSASLGNTESRPNPFAYDARNFTWLRGIVDYDSQDQRWVIIYSANPDASDRHGGSITLSDYSLLSRVKPGDVVYVEGCVDLSSLDQHGKPIYRVDELKLMKPRTN